MHSHKPVIRKRSRGANLAILCAVGTLIIGFMGICIYSGLQAFLESDLKRASMNAAMAGAAAYYSTLGASGKPTPDPTTAKTVASNTFTNIVNNSSLSGFQATVSETTNNDSNDSITLTTKASIKTPFLTLIGINTLETTAKATARALKYEPTRFTGMVSILPVAGNIASYSKKINLAFPLVDGPGTDLYVEQDVTTQQAYIVEACNDQECYSLVPGATPVGTSKIVSLAGGEMGIIGTATIDLARAGVRKASVLRFVHGNNFTLYNAGVGKAITAPTPLVIRRVMLFGYAGACVNDKTCAIPAGFVPVE